MAGTRPRHGLRHQSTCRLGRRARRWSQGWIWSGKQCREHQQGERRKDRESMKWNDTILTSGSMACVVFLTNKCCDQADLTTLYFTYFCGLVGITMVYPHSSSCTIIRLFSLNEIFGSLQSIGINVQIRDMYKFEISRFSGRYARRYVFRTLKGLDCEQPSNQGLHPPQRTMDPKLETIDSLS